MSKIEDNVCKKLQDRAEIGKNKYGVTMERNDLSYSEWLNHAQQEAMDFCVYLEKLMEYPETKLEGQEVLTKLTIDCIRNLTSEQQIFLAKDLLERNNSI